MQNPLFYRTAARSTRFFDLFAAGRHMLPVGLGAMLQYVVRLSTVMAAMIGSALPALAEEPLPRVPEGFTIEKAAASPLVKHPMMAGFDERGRLFVAESAGRNLRSPDLLEELPNFIRMLEDTTGDGRFDKSTIFAEDMTFPQGALWYRGALYVASPPSIWRLEDTTGDGVADKREEIVGTFGFRGNAADIHGCFLAPTGRIYWCDGRHGHEFRDAQGNITSQGKAARIFSCRPDGSDVEIFCGGGMDNPVEIDFTPEGEMLGTVNILLSNPREDCLMHWVEGGVYPRYDQEDCLAEFQQTGDPLLPMTKLGHVAVSGMTRYRSTHFGPEYRNNVFLTVFNTNKVLRSIITRSGATFESREEEFLVSDNPDFRPTDVLEDADGSLLVIDTGGWFRIGCPQSQVAKPEIHGAIYRIRRKDAPAVEDPRGLTLGLEDKNPDQLVPFLDDPRPAVRERAIDLSAQAERAAIPALERLVAQGNEGGVSIDARRNAVWALSRMESDDSLRVIREALTDESESIRLAAVHALGTRRDPAAIARLARRVVEDTPAVRREAATALGRICQAGQTEATVGEKTAALDALFAGLSEGVADRVLEHALIYAVIRTADREKTIPYLTGSSPLVRRGALIALDQMEGGDLTRELVTPLLDTDDPALQKQALEIIGRHEGWASEMLQLLRSWLAEPELTDERSSMLRGVLLAQSRDADIQRLITETLKRPNLAPSVQLLLLEVIHRSAVEPLPESWVTAIGRGVKHGGPEVRLQAVRILQDQQLDQFDELLLEQVVPDEEQPSELRVEALIAVAPRLERLEEASFRFLMQQLDPEVPPLDRLAAARALADLPLGDGQLVELASRLDAAGPLALPVLLRAFTGSDSKEIGMALVAALDGSPAVSSLSPDEFAGLVRAYPPEVRQAAEGLLKRLGADPEKQRARLEELASLTNGGDEEKGRQVFFGKKAACAGCHTVAGEGGKVGPDLSTIGAIRNGDDLLEAIVFPSASFARGYRTYVILTIDGRVHTGVISRQSAHSISLRTAELAEVRIPRDQIEEMRESPTSVMPAGLNETLNEEELRDLLAYLRRLK